MQLSGEILGFSLVGELQLILQIVEPIVHRGRGEHQHLGLHAFPDDFAHEPLVARFPALGVIRIAEIMRFVDHQEVVVAPIDAIQRYPQGHALLPRQIGMRENIVVETVFGENIGRQIRIVIRPIFGEFLRAEDQHRFIPQFVVLDDGQCGECLPQSDAVR